MSVIADGMLSVYRFLIEFWIPFYVFAHTEERSLRVELGQRVPHKRSHIGYGSVVEGKVQDGVSRLLFFVPQQTRVEVLEQRRGFEEVH